LDKRKTKSTITSPEIQEPRKDEETFLGAVLATFRKWKKVHRVRPAKTRIRRAALVSASYADYIGPP